MDSIRLLKHNYSLDFKNKSYQVEDDQNFERKCTKLSACKASMDIKKESFTIDWESLDDERDPQKWTFRKKVACTFMLGQITFLVTLCSAIGTGTYEQVAAEFDEPLEMACLTTSMFLVGFALGAPLLAPLSEEVGRLPIYIVGLLLFSCFQIGAAVSQNIGTLAVCRFFAGFFGTPPLSNTGGSLADLWNAKQMTLAFPAYGVAGFLGPCFGAIIGSYISVSYLGWRWTNYLMAIVGFSLSLVCFIVMPETYKPIIMDLKARRIRQLTGDKRYKSLHEIQLEGKSIFSVSVFMRPIEFFVKEPIVTIVTICISIAYIVLFTDFESFKYVFGAWSFLTAKSSLPFISVALGIITAIAIAPLCYYYQNHKIKVLGSFELIRPEFRLIPLMYSCWGIPASLFWVGWTNYSSISPWCSIVALYFFGLGTMQVYITSYMYIIDSYGSNSASALSTLTLVRYLVSGGMIHVATPMYKNLGVHWACSLLGFISFITCASPFFFWYFGPKLRSYSKFTKTY